MAVDEQNSEIINEPSESEQRIKQLSKKISLTTEELVEKDRLLKEESTKSTEFQKERDFYVGFSDVVSTNPLAKDHKDEILTKFKSGYSLEDATFAVLGKAGKLASQAPEPTPSPIGGSAPTAIPQGGVKTPQEMSQSERKAALIEAEARGDIFIS